MKPASRPSALNADCWRTPCTQIAMHQEYGAWCLKLASRDHIRRVTPLTRQVLEEAGIGMADVGAVAYTAGPGLAGALLVGASVAQALAWSRRLPAIGIHHLEGHLLSPMLADPRPEFPSWPCWCLAAIPS